MDINDQRDFAEELANEREMRDELEAAAERADLARCVVATRIGEWPRRCVLLRDHRGEHEFL